MAFKGFLLSLIICVLATGVPSALQSETISANSVSIVHAENIEMDTDSIDSKDTAEESTPDKAPRFGLPPIVIV